MNIKRYFLDNGLEVFLQEDKTVPVAVVNILYKAGSKNDPRGKKGIAHLFEHLMFCNKNTSYDYEMQQIGAINNAYTNYDITNYYCSVPAEHLDRALWLEADRMRDLNITQESLTIQQNVVIEELKQSYHNSPYGDVIIHLMEMLFVEGHPYHAPIIGYKEDILSVTIEDIQFFKRRYYTPSNAILVVSGCIDISSTQESIKRYFENIEYHCDEMSCDCHSCAKAFFCKNSRLVSHGSEGEAIKTLTRAVPAEAICCGFITPSRIDKEFYATAILSEILSCGDSSLLYKNLVEKDKIFSSIDLEYLDCLFSGVFVINAFLMSGVTVEQAQQKLTNTINKINEEVDNREIQKAKNNILFSLARQAADIQDRNDLVVNLLHVRDNIDHLEERIKNTTNDEIIKLIDEIFKKHPWKVMFLKSQKKQNSSLGD
ncbi:MAG: insulinase family protein [Cytophagales bacterium]|nr:insulinase family protein [Cytophagales bacterium]